MESTRLFTDVVRSRRSVRGFLPKPVDRKIIEEVLLDAQCAPSNCNSQPWKVHIVSGAALDRVRQIFSDATRANQMTPDFPLDASTWPEAEQNRQKAQGKKTYKTIGLARDDKKGRLNFFVRNAQAYGAPHVAFLFMSSLDAHVRTAGDVGMYGQNFLLSLEARGLGGVPQTYLGFFAEQLRKELNVPEEHKLLFAISFGYPDAEDKLFNFDAGRAKIEESVTFHE